MFGLFKGNNKKSLETEIALMKTIFTSLGDEYSYIINQLNDNIISGVKRVNTPFPNYRKFSLNVDTLNNYEKKNGNYFSIKGIKIYDSNLKEFVGLEIDIAYGILQGYTPNVIEFNPDISNINLKDYSIMVFEEESSSIKELFAKEELAFLNVNDIYEVKLKGKIYFHIIDLEDGDFIGIDSDKKIYKITHNPFEITLLEVTLMEIIKS